MNWKDARLQLVLLVVVFALAMVHFFAGATASIKQHLRGADFPAVPYVSDMAGHVVRPSQAGAAGGLRSGDRMLALNGEPYQGRITSFDVERDARPGQPLTIRVQHADGSTADLHLRFEHDTLAISRTAAWAYVILAEILLPLFCILIGAWVVAARPNVATAWLMLGILLLFPALLFNFGMYTRPFIYFVPYYSSLAESAGFLCIMLFGLYFPQRSRADTVLPWLKWVIGVPLMGTALLDLLEIYAHNLDANAFSWLLRLLPAASTVSTTLEITCVFFFIAVIARSAHVVNTADARRRLHVLLYGAVCGMTPLLFLTLWNQSHGGNPESLPLWITLSCLSLTFLFPLSLAYVVVVQRAMDVRILLRQGTQYALARGTLTGVRVLLGVGLTIAAIRASRHGFAENGEMLLVAALAAAFTLFRYRFADRLSASLDRRFFREAYSAELMLAELSEEARGFTETVPLLRTVTQRLAETLHVDRIAVLIRNGHSFTLQHAVGLNGSMPVPVAFADSSQTVRNLNREHRPATVYHDNPDGWLFLATEQERRLLRELQSEVLLPLPGRNKLVGVISLGAKRSEQPYSRADLQMLQSVALQTGLAIENSELIGSLAREAAQRERLNREIEIAREVQDRLLPQSFPHMPGVDCSGICRPAQGVGGDYYDFIQIDSQRLGIAIGDVSGKGISAALLMAGLRASLRAVMLSGSGDLAEVIQNVNQLVYEASAENRYATFFFAVYDAEERALDYVNAGHNPPLVVRPPQEQELVGVHGYYRGEACAVMTECEVLKLEEGGPVVGLLPLARYSSGRVLLQPSDLLIAYTDGVSEAMNWREDEWSEEQMVAAAAKCASKSAGEVVRCLMEEADRFTDGAPQHDDMTLAVVKLL